MTILSDTHCEQSGTVGRWFKNGDPTMICAERSNGKTCRGDSGGPLICVDDDNQPILTGITSWGSSGCSQESTPSVFTEIGNAKIHSFIMEHLDKTSKVRV